MTILPVDGITVHDERHEIAVACGGEDYLITEADFLALGISQSGTVDIEKLSFFAEKLACIKKAQSYLSSGDLSTRRLGEKLKLTKSFGDDVISAVINLLTEKGYLDDSSLAERRADELAEKRRWGKMRIKNYLYEKGFTRDDINNALENTDANIFTENLTILIKREVAGKKYDLSDRKSKAKLGNFLFRAGYSWDEIKSALEDCMLEKSTLDEYAEEGYTDE